MAKKNVSDNLERCDFDFINIDEVIETLQEYKEKYSKNYLELYLNLEDFGDYNKLFLCGRREETDQEYNTRCAEENKQQEELRIEELKEYERLKLKLGKQ